MEKPLVSIIIPVYNGSNYMRQAIDSALAQTYEHTEVLVVNDGSDDQGQTDAIARSYGNRIRYFCKPNGGVSSALNEGIRNMRGDYFSWLSHDDLYEPDKVEKQVAALKNADGNTLICCGYSQIDENSRPISGYKPPVSFRPGQTYTWQAALDGLLNHTSIHGCCLLIPRGAFERSGLFDESLRFCQDTFMWYNIFLNGYSLLCTLEVSVKSRVHAGQLTQTGQSLFKRDCAAVSGFLTRAFAQASGGGYNFLKRYLLDYAKYLGLDQIRMIIATGREKGLISRPVALKAYLLYGYGMVRPLIRKVYYRVFRRIRTN